MARYGQRPENALKRANGKKINRHICWSPHVFIYITN
jgi:hypothetical protein